MDEQKTIEKQEQTMDEKELSLPLPLDALQQEVAGAFPPFDDHAEELPIDEEIVIEAYNKAKETEKPKTKKKSILFSLLFLAINILLVVFLSRSLLKTTDASFLEICGVQGKRLLWLLLSFGLVALALVADASVFSLLIKKNTGKFRPWLAYKTTAMGKYYEAVTPLALGMQPGQIVELSKGGVSAGVATSIPIMKMIIYNVLNVLVSLVFLICVGINIQPVSVLADAVLIVFKVFAYAGLVIGTGIILVVILISNSKLIGRSLARFVVRVGYKLRIVKNYREAYSKIMKSVLEFQNSMTYFKKHKGIMFGVVGCIIVSLLAISSVPFSVSLALSDVTFASPVEGLWYWLECVTRFFICYWAAAYIPLPGGTGMTEIAFISMFGSSRFFGTNIVWGFLFWRIITYYLLIAQGFGFVVGSTAKKIYQVRKNSKAKVKKSKSKQQ